MTCQKSAFKLLEERIIPDKVLLLSPFAIEQFSKDNSPIDLSSMKTVFGTRSGIVCANDEHASVSLEVEIQKAVLSQRVNLHTSLAPVTCPHVCVIGMPNVGKTSLVMYLQKITGAIPIFPESVSSPKNLFSLFFFFALSKKEKRLYRSVVASHIKHRSKFGVKAEKFIQNQQKDELLVTMITNDIFDIRNGYLKKGWIIDGFPTSVQQAQLMVKKGLQPNRIIALTMDLDKIKQFDNVQESLDLFTQKKDNESTIELIKMYPKDVSLVNNYLSQYSGVEEFEIRDGTIQERNKIMELSYDFVIQPLGKKVL
ncbi:hypothetical protein RFI_04919 [Reticulomyxa filosa]|uniref:Adenylate kinase n=1 Tax=Reticulomyxa filosa TaxID=46433 RepID=X6P2A1_RETFI|nr:hypothetical protein RFI_04919 [Reticulomyxa filosa]|eukprot:ETO32199.1 hypothetical protein RFI_04919 [Reticulomyxa filosa]